MCDLTQFTISTLLPTKKSSALLAKLFMEQVVLTFGIVAVVVVDTESTFKSNWKDMCYILNIIFGR